jgi:hypothetical protein
MQANSTVFWLKTAAAVTMGFGVLVAAAALPAAAGITRFLVDLVFWPVDGGQSLAAPETRLFCAIAGGVMAGWGITMWLIATRLYAREPELARTMILEGAVTWFVIDSIGSTLAGAPGNVLLNIPFLLMFVLPLWRPSGTAPAASAR